VSDQVADKNDSVPTSSGVIAMKYRLKKILFRHWFAKDRIDTETASTRDTVMTATYDATAYSLTSSAAVFLVPYN